MNNLKLIVIISQHIQEWCVPFLAPLPDMDWISMKKVPDWKCVSEYHCYIKTVYTDFTVAEELFDKRSCLKQ